jgi:hypothetical protein
MSVRCRSPSPVRPPRAVVSPSPPPSPTSRSARSSSVESRPTLSSRTPTSRRLSSGLPLEFTRTWVSPFGVLSPLSAPSLTQWYVRPFSGQSCTAGSRILVQEDIYDEFCTLFAEAANAVAVGDPLHPDTFIGAQVSKVQFDKILGFIEDGKKTARLIAGGTSLHLLPSFLAF